MTILITTLLIMTILIITLLIMTKLIITLLTMTILITLNAGEVTYNYITYS